MFLASLRAYRYIKLTYHIIMVPYGKESQSLILQDATLCILTWLYFSISACVLFVPFDVRL